MPYSSVTENADGTYTIVWDPASMPKLTHATVNDSWTITFPSRTRTNYQSGFTDQGPILAHDSATNAVSLAGVALPRCTAPGAADCSPAGPRIDHDNPLARAVTDAASAGQSAPLPSIDKQIAQSGTNCATATYTNTIPAYLPGDRICWLLNVNFPGGVDTAAPRVNDFLPPTVTYESGSDTATPANTVGSTFDASGAAQGSLVWNLTGGLVPKGSQVFQHTISSVVQPTGQLAPGQLPGNLMKFSASGTSGVSFPYRDQADFVLALPVIGLTKGVQQVNSGAVNGPNVDGVTVKGGDTVTYRVDLSNTGTADAKNVVVWDLLPTEYDCATIGQITAISDAGTCVDAPFPAQDRIQWTVPSLAQAATKTLTYKVGIPTGVGPGRTLVNHAGVRSFQTQSNLGTFFTYTPASNIDTANATPSNVPAADNFSNVVTRNVTITKAAATPVDAPGNTAAQATIGENITYTVTTVIPDGTSVPADFKIADAVSRAAGLPGGLGLGHAQRQPARRRLDHQRGGLHADGQRTRRRLQRERRRHDDRHDLHRPRRRPRHEYAPVGQHHEHRQRDLDRPGHRRADEDLDRDDDPGRRAADHADEVRQREPRPRDPRPDRHVHADDHQLERHPRLDRPRHQGRRRRARGADPDRRGARQPAAGRRRDRARDGRRDVGPGGAHDHAHGRGHQSEQQPRDDLPGQGGQPRRRRQHAHEHRDGDDHEHGGDRHG